MPSHIETIRRHPLVPRTHRSVSLEHDHASGQARPFIITACARRAIQRIAGGISSPSSSRAWTLTGPFGTGKSSFCLFLSRLLSPPASKDAKVARKLLQEVDPSLLASLQIGKGLIPIVITGSREPITTSLIRGLVGVLDMSAANGAKKLAKELRDTGNDSRRDPIKLLDRTVSCLIADGKTAGVIVIFDELGKLLEYAACNSARSDVYLLQRLAEYASRAEVPTLLIGVLHQDFTGYAHELSESQRQEWEKVRGRFEDVIFEQSADDMLRLIADAMVAKRGGETGIKGGPNTFKSLSEVAWTSKIVPPGLEPHQGLPLLAACYPLHPCVTLLLGPIFKRFGQNERSAFSFLSSGEPHALPEFIATGKENDLYNIVHLYKYLVGTFGDSLISSKDGKRWAEAFNVESQHPDLTSDELHLLRTIAILGIVGRWNGIAPNPEVLKFALAPAMTPAEVDRSIKSLLLKSAIVYRRFNDTYNLWEGSDIDVEARVTDARSRIAADASTVQLLRSSFTPRPLLARRHSFESGTLRYFDVVFATTATLADTITAFDQVADRMRADGEVIIVLPDTRGGLVDRFEKSIPLLTSHPDTLLCIPGNAREIESLARELSAIQWVRKATTDLQTDATARRELAAREENIRRQLEKAVAEVLIPAVSGNSSSSWIWMGEKQKISSSRALNELLSSICGKLYSSAPIIQNEIINRRELSSSAAAAQRNLIDRMLRHGRIEGLGIEGTPPEQSIYLSVLRGLKLHEQHHGQWGFATSEKSVRNDAQPVYRAIKQYFNTANNVPLGLDELFTLLRRPPYGLRDGVIPIFVCAALIANEADVAVYEDGGFLPQLTDAVFEKLVKDPARYAIRRWHVSGVRMTVFEQLAKMLGQSPVTECVEARDLLDVVKPLVRFVRKLNIFMQQTKALAPTTVAVREAIANASEPDHLLFKDLPLACGIVPFTGSKKDHIEAVNEFLRVLQGAINELQRGYSLLLQSLTEELSQLLDASDTESKSRHELMKRAANASTVALNPEIKVFTTRLADGTADDAMWIEQIASFLTNKHPSLWHDDDRGRFTVRLGQMADAFKGLESLVIARKDFRDEDECNESIRISVVGTRSPQAEQVVHLSRQETEQVRDIEAKLAILFKPYSQKGNRKLVIAAIAKAAQTIFNDGSHNRSNREGAPK